MWEQYKKTFVRMQVIISVVTLGVLVCTHLVGMAGVFFATMQIGAIAGAMWGHRLKERVRRATYLPARRG